MERIASIVIRKSTMLTVDNHADVTSLKFGHMSNAFISRSRWIAEKKAVLLGCFSNIISFEPEDEDR